MTGPKSIRIAVISDVHAFPGKYGDASPGWLGLGDDQSNPKSNPFAGVLDLIARETMKADVVVCGGDLGDKASPDAQQYVWQQIEQVRVALGASLTIGTAGNHDLDSRFSHNNYDAKGQLQSLSPLFPVNDNEKWMEYWAQNYTIIEYKGVRFITLNSAAYHGYASDPAKPESQHGRVSDQTLDRLTADLASRGAALVNVLLVHHHPYKNDVIKIVDYSDMKNGDKLINDLTGIRVGPWLVIHGHKHIPRLFYGPGGNLAPAIFSAGSFSARIWPESAEIARNEFYIMDLHVPSSVGSATSSKGKINTWQWSYGNGWIRPKFRSGLGPSAAFGTRADIGELAEELADHLSQSFGGKTVTWEYVETYKKGIEYLIPEDMDALTHILTQVYHMKLVTSFETGAIAELQVP